MKLDFHATASHRIVAVTGDYGYTNQNITMKTWVNNGDTLSIDINPNRYLPPNSPWRLVTEDGTVLPWPPDGEAPPSASEIIDFYARDLARRRPAD